MKMGDDPGQTLKGVFKIRGKLYDVYLDGEEVVWTLQDSGTQAYDISTRSLKLSDVIGAWIAKRRSPSDPSKEGQLVGFTLFTFSKAGNRKLSEARVTFECDDESTCETWIEKINDVIKGGFSYYTGLLILCNDVILPNCSQIASNRIIHKKSCTVM